MQLTELNWSVYRIGWHSVWRTLRKTLTMFFNENHVFTSAVTRTKRPWLWTATPTPWTWANDAKRNFIYRQLHKYIATNFSTSQLSICVDEKTQVCTATIVFRRHRLFRLTKNWTWLINIRGRCLEWHWYVAIMYWIWLVISGGPFRGPLVPSQTRCFEGATRSFRGARPPRAPS